MIRSGGGAATAGGMDFQHRVGAWAAAHILAEKQAPPPWDLPTETTLEWLRCETEQPVDDLLVGTSAEGLVFAQVKRTLGLSEAVESVLASALDQFVRQYIDCRGRTSGGQLWDRPLDATMDRFALITSSRSSEPIRLHLPVLLRRLRAKHADQTLDSIVTNDDERRVLSTVRTHVMRSWKGVLGADLSDDELAQILSLVRVQVLDLEEGSPGKREAKSLLRTSILQNPLEDEAAWANLISYCAGLATERSGAARSDLQHMLLRAGFNLVALQSYQNDIRRLKQYSKKTLSALSHLAQIRVGSVTVRIKRPPTEALRHAAEEASVLVVGEPGAGKSGTLHDLVEALEENKCDCVFVAVDRLRAQSMAGLTTDIGLGHELSEVLNNWPGTSPAFLVIDALDAARGEPSSTMIRDLIREVVSGHSRWHVVASMRKFDLRYGVEIKQLFAGVPPTSFKDPEFEGIRHVNIPRLSDDELDQVAAQAPALQTLLDSALPDLHDLLRVLFNLRLMAELLGIGVQADEIGPMRTQLDLLDRYWTYRVIRSDGGDAREAVLRLACERMVEARALRIDRSVVTESTSGSDSLEDLLSTQVLIEWQLSPEVGPERYILAFSHHVVFDYAVARLLLRGTLEVVIRRLVDNPEMLVVVRPSFVLHFRHLWTADKSRRLFWDLTLRLMRVEQIPEIGRLIGPSVAAELARALPDLEPLYMALDGPSRDNVVAEQALGHVLGALLAGVSAETSLVGPDAGPWCHLLEVASRAIRRSLAYIIRPCISAACEHPDKLTPAQRIAAGDTARRLLDFAWSEPARDQWLVVHALQCVCRTFESDPAASSGLIRRCLEPQHLSQYGFEELPWLAREVKSLVDFDPVLVGEVYLAVFSYQETSAEPTPIGGRIIPMVSNRRQDYQMALHELAKEYPSFLDHAPLAATRALIGVAEAYVAQNHSLTLRGEQVDTFNFGGRQIRLCADYSAMWDEGDTYRHEEVPKMLDPFQEYLEKLAADPESTDSLRAVVDLLVAENRLAVLWRRALRVAAKFPQSLGRLVLPFAWAVPILTCSDTTHLAGEFIGEVFPTLGTCERQCIERAVLSISEAFPNRREAGERARNRLLGCLPVAALVTEEAKRLLDQLRSNNDVPVNEPPVLFTSWTGTYGEEEFLKDQGVPVEAEANRRIRELEKPIKEFASKHLNSVPTREDSSDLLPHLQDLYDALSRAEEHGVHPKQSDHALDSLVAACGRIARADWLSLEDALGSFLHAVLIEASRHAEPDPDPETDAHFDEFPSWGSPAPRIEAAEGLIALVRIPNHATSEVLDALERLSSDPVPAVRFQVARNLTALYNTDPDLMWRLLECKAREEPSAGVLQGLLSGSINRLASANPDRIADLVKVVLDRMRVGPGAKEVRQFCAGFFSGMYIWRDHAQSREITLGIAANPVAYPDEALHAMSQVRGPLEAGPTYPVDPVQDAVWHRALELTHRILRSARDGLREIEERHWPPQEQETARSLARLIDDVGMEIYFTSGAFKGKGQGEVGTEEPKRERSERFYRETVPMLYELADTGLASVTHHLVETLEFFVPLDPRGVFLCIGQVVRAGKKNGYQYESLAANLIVRLVERYLAEYRTLLRDDEDCRNTLVEILDVFVLAGWASARRLTYRLEEIFR